VEVPREVPHVVPTALRASGDHGRVRTGGVRVFRLGRLMVSEKKERLPIRVSISRRLNVFVLRSQGRLRSFVSPDGDFGAAVSSVYLRFTMHLHPLPSHSLYHRCPNPRSLASVDTVYYLHLLWSAKTCASFNAYFRFRIRFMYNLFCSPDLFLFSLDLYSTKTNLTRW